MSTTVWGDNTSAEKALWIVGITTVVLWAVWGIWFLFYYILHGALSPEDPRTGLSKQFEDFYDSWSSTTKAIYWIVMVIFYVAPLFILRVASASIGGI